MSTNHTEHYALSLWEASDQVTRTEFNENHAKIDAALNAAAQTAERADYNAGLKLLKTVSLENSATTFVIPMDDIEWEKYSAVCVYLQIYTESFETVTATMTGMDNMQFTTTPTKAIYSNEPVHASQIWFFPFYLAHQRVKLIGLGFSGGLKSGDLTNSYEYLNQITITSPSTSTFMVPRSKVLIFAHH